MDLNLTGKMQLCAEARRGLDWRPQLNLLYRADVTLMARDEKKLKDALKI